MNITTKKLKANKQNALKGGVKTKEGKEKVKMNAVKHWLSASVYDGDLEKQLLSEYKVEGTLEKMLVKNICINKARYERGVELEFKLLAHILNPTKLYKKYESEKEYLEYLERKDEDYIVDIHGEPDYTYKYQEGEEFNYDVEKIRYLVEILGKYNYQNEVRLNKNIVAFLKYIDKMLYN